MDYSSRLHAVIPGGAHTYSRGDDQYPRNAPPILVRGEGCHVWSPDGRRFLDYGMALRSVTVGYAEPSISEAAVQEIWKGNNLTRASLTELEAAERLVDLIPSAEMVKFAKNGSNVTTAAIKLARAYTGRQRVALCRDHPFFSFDDWFIGSTVMRRGIPEEVTAQTLGFTYNDLDSLRALFAQHPGEIAAVILEPVTCVEPAEGYLQAVKELCHREGAVFILDEMITGFRWHLRGAQHLFGVEPDLSTFGKGMANGFSVAALVGRREIMRLGGILDEGAERVFLVSTTHGGEMSALGAFLRTVDVYRERDVVGHLWSYGKRLVDGMNDIARRHGVESYFRVEGYPCSPVYVTRGPDGAPSFEFRALFSQELIKSGVLMPWIALSAAHGDAELDLTLAAVDQALACYAKALSDGVGAYLDGPGLRPVFRSHN